MRFASLEHQIIADNVEAFLGDNRPREAMNEFQKLPPEVQETAEGLYWRVQVEGKLGDIDAATKTLQAGVERFPDYRWPHVLLAALFAAGGKTVMAELALKHPSVGFKDWEIALELAKYSAIQHPERAREFYSDAVAKAPDQNSRDAMAEAAEVVPHLKALLTSRN